LTDISTEIIINEQNPNINYLINAKITTQNWLNVGIFELKIIPEKQFLAYIYIKNENLAQFFPSFDHKITIP
jgi:hypothetical protein